jgi:hypothetical protein
MYAYTYVKLCRLHKEFTAYPISEITPIQETVLCPQKIKKKKKEKRTLIL